MRKYTKVTDKTKFLILVDLCRSKGINVCELYQESFTDTYPQDDTRWWYFKLYSLNGSYGVSGTNPEARDLGDDDLITYEGMIDYIIGIRKELRFNLSNYLDARYTQGDDYATIGVNEIQVLKLKEFLDKINQLNN